MAKFLTTTGISHRGFVFLFLVGALSADAGPAGSHVGNRVFPIMYLSEEILPFLDQNDGSVEDWLEAIGEPTLTPLDFFLDSRYPLLTSYDQYDPSNLDFRIWMGWNDDGKIYVAGQFADDEYVNEHDPFTFPYSLFQVHDSMSLLADGDHTGGQLYWIQSHGELDEALKTNRQAQSYYALSRVPSGPMVSLGETTDHTLDFFDESVDWMVQPPFARGGGSVSGENPTVWIVEFYVTCFDHLHHLNPEESVASQFAEGKIMGFDLGVLDFDSEPGGLGANFTLVDPVEFEKDGIGADFFVDGLLLGPDDDVGSLVQSVSWGRIKAALEIDLRSDSFSED